MKESLKLVFILTVICTVAGLALAVVYNLTYVPIQAAKAAEKQDAIRRVLTEPDTAQALRERGIERARELRWDRTARRTLDVLREVASRPT